MQNAAKVRVTAQQCQRSVVWASVWRTRFIWPRLSEMCTMVLFSFLFLFSFRLFAADLPFGHGRVLVVDHPGVWSVWRNSLVMTAKTDEKKVAGEIHVCFQHLERIQAVFGRAKALDPPVGFNVDRSRSIRDNALEPGVYPASYSLSMYEKGFFRTCQDCKIEVSHEGRAINVYVNSLGPIIPQTRLYTWGLSSVAVFPEPRRVADMGGFPVWEGDFRKNWTVIAKAGRPLLWKRLSNERALTLAIQGFEKEIERIRKLSRSPSSFQSRARIHMASVESLRRELVSLTAEQRVADAYRCRAQRGKPRSPSSLCYGPAGPDAQFLVAANPDYWDRSLARTTPQLLVIDLLTIDPMNMNRAYPDVSAWEVGRRQRIIDSLDWKALGSIVNPSH